MFWEVEYPREKAGVEPFNWKKNFFSRKNGAESRLILEKFFNCS